MRRREFLKSAVLSTLVPTALHPHEPRHNGVDLSRFCADEESPRFDLRHPFSQADWTFACNYHIAVRVPLDRSMDQSSDARLPDAGTLPWDAGRCWRPWRPVEEKVDTGAPCPDCNVWGRIGGCRCENCDGDGCYLHGCDDGWIGGVTCGRCKGTGEIETAFRVAGRIVSPIYERLVTSLPDVEVSLTELPNVYAGEKKDGDGPIAFRFQGGSGLVMPLVK